MSKTQHVHKWKRHTYKTGNAVYFCALPDCNKKMTPALTLGKRAICWRCGEEFIMNDYSVRLAKPHCTNCHKPKGDLDIEANITPPKVIVPIESVLQQPIDTADDLARRLAAASSDGEDVL